MNATLLEPDARRDADLLALVSEMREEISQLRREVSELRCDVGYWKSRHADAVKRNEKLEQELALARGNPSTQGGSFWQEVREAAIAPTTWTISQDQPRQTAARPAAEPSGPARRDYAHLPVRETFLELPPKNACVIVAESRWRTWADRRFRASGNGTLRLSASDASSPVSSHMHVSRPANPDGARAAEVDSQKPDWLERVGSLVAGEVPRSATDPTHARTTSLPWIGSWRPAR